MLCTKIVHVYSPQWNGTNQAQSISELDKAVKNILTISDTNEIKTLALPSISSGKLVLNMKKKEEYTERQIFLFSNEHKLNYK